MKKDRILVLAFVSFFIVELIARMFDFYSTYAYYDDLSHVLFGLSMYGFIYFFFPKTKFVVTSLIYLFIALFWELLEKIGDSLFSQPSYLLDFFYFDGIFDVLFGYIGLLIAYYYFHNMK